MKTTISEKIFRQEKIFEIRYEKSKIQWNIFEMTVWSEARKFSQLQGPYAPIMINKLKFVVL